MSTSTLKKSSDGLSKSWEVQSSLKPFYSGSKIDIHQNQINNSNGIGSGSSGGGQFGCLFNETLSIVDLETLAVKTNVLNEATPTSNTNNTNTNDGEVVHEGVTCFCLLPGKEEVVVAMASTYVLKHIHIGIASTSSTAVSNGSNAGTTGSGVSVIRTIKGHQMPILAMECDTTGSILATGSSDRIVRVFDIARGYCTHTFRNHSDIISIVRFIPSISMNSTNSDSDSDANNIDICSASDDKSIQIHNLGSNTQSEAFYEHMATPTCISLASSASVPELQLLASSGRDKVINLYAVQSSSTFTSNSSSSSKNKSKHMDNSVNKYTFIKTILMKTDELEAISFISMTKNTTNSSSKSKSNSKPSTKSDNCVECILAAGGSCGTLKIISIVYSTNDCVEYHLNYEYSLHTLLVQQIQYIPSIDELLVTTATPRSCGWMRLVRTVSGN